MLHVPVRPSGGPHAGLFWRTWSFAPPHVPEATGPLSRHLLSPPPAPTDEPVSDGRFSPAKSSETPTTGHTRANNTVTKSTRVGSKSISGGSGREPYNSQFAALTQLNRLRTELGEITVRRDRGALMGTACPALWGCASVYYQGLGGRGAGGNQMTGLRQRRVLRRNQLQEFYGSSSCATGKRVQVSHGPPPLSIISKA
jgi:hypothetical protein